MKQKKPDFRDVVLLAVMAKKSFCPNMREPNGRCACLFVLTGSGRTVFNPLYQP